MKDYTEKKLPDVIQEYIYSRPLISVLISIGKDPSKFTEKIVKPARRHF